MGQFTVTSLYAPCRVPLPVARSLTDPQGSPGHTAFCTKCILRYIKLDTFSKKNHVVIGQQHRSKEDLLFFIIFKEKDFTAFKNFHLWCRQNLFLGFEEVHFLQLYCLGSVLK